MKKSSFKSIIIHYLALLIVTSFALNCSEGPKRSPIVSTDTQQSADGSDIDGSETAGDTETGETTGGNTNEAKTNSSNPINEPSSNQIFTELMNQTQNISPPQITNLVIANAIDSYEALLAHAVNVLISDIKNLPSSVIPDLPCNTNIEEGSDRICTNDKTNTYFSKIDLNNNYLHVDINRQKLLSNWNKGKIISYLKLLQLEDSLVDFSFDSNKRVLTPFDFKNFIDEEKKTDVTDVLKVQKLNIITQGVDASSINQSNFKIIDNINRIASFKEKISEKKAALVSPQNLTKIDIENIKTFIAQLENSIEPLKTEISLEMTYQENQDDKLVSLIKNRILVTLSSYIGLGHWSLTQNDDIKKGFAFELFKSIENSQNPDFCKNTQAEPSNSGAGSTATNEVAETEGDANPEDSSETEGEASPEALDDTVRECDIMDIKIDWPKLLGEAVSIEELDL